MKALPWILLLFFVSGGGVASAAPAGDDPEPPDPDPPPEPPPQDEFDCAVVDIDQDGEFVALDADPDEPNVYNFPDDSDVSVAAATFNAIINRNYCAHYTNAPLGAEPASWWATLGTPSGLVRHIAAEIHWARTFTQLTDWNDANSDMYYVREHFTTSGAEENS